MGREAQFVVQDPVVHLVAVPGVERGLQDVHKEIRKRGKEVKEDERNRYPDQANKHLVENGADAPPINRHPVLLLLQDLRGCKGGRPAFEKESLLKMRKGWGKTNPSTLGSRKKWTWCLQSQSPPWQVQNQSMQRGLKEGEEWVIVGCFFFNPRGK